MCLLAAESFPSVPLWQQQRSNFRHYSLCLFTRSKWADYASAVTFSNINNNSSSALNRCSLAHLKETNSAALCYWKSWRLCWQPDAACALISVCLLAAFHLLFIYVFCVSMNMKLSACMPLCVSFQCRSNVQLLNDAVKLGNISSESTAWTARWTSVPLNIKLVMSSGHFFISPCSFPSFIHQFSLWFFSSFFNFHFAQLYSKRRICQSEGLLEFMYVLYVCEGKAGQPEWVISWIVYYKAIFTLSVFTSFSLVLLYSR